MSSRCWATTVGGSLAYAAVAALSFAFRPIDTVGLLVNLAPMFCFFVAGVVALRAQPGSVPARWLLAAGVAGGAMVATGVVSGLFGWTGWPVFLVGAVAQCLALACWLAAFATYPGRDLDRGYERVVVSLALAAAVVLPLLAVFGNGRLTLLSPPVDHPPQAVSPLFLPPLAPLGQAYTALYLLPVVALVLLGLRFRRAAPVLRRRLEWPLFACGLAAVFFAASALFPGLDPRVASVLFVVASCAVPAAAGVGLVRPELFDIALVLRRSPVYLLLWLAIAGAYALLAVTLGLTAGHQLSMPAAVGVTIVAAVLFQPARVRLERLADRLVFGRRLDGYTVLRELGGDLERSVQPQDLARRVTAAVADGLRASWCRLFGEEEELLGQAGTWTADPAMLSVPVGYGDTTLGRIECGPRREGRYTDRDRDVLAAVARQVGLGLHDARQTLELAASRTRLVHAAEAERRRLERDLHDGVQQHLVALMAKVELARRRPGTDPVAADSLAEAQQLGRRAVQELRQLAQGIHPAVLTDEGLPSAVRTRAGALPIPVHVQVGSGAQGRRFSADSEAAAYFLISEALTNVAKHAAATTATVHIDSHDGVLCVEVVDDGRGFAGMASPRGLRGLQDRLEALGGRLEFGSLNGSGARVRGQLPA